ncbi:Protein Y37A1B.5 a [Aphelenchoides avenae]|nr:Protein Y37A1B.5 a [Aphelenchus avenae]
MIASVDVDPSSPTYCKVVSKVLLPHIGDEVHHTGWNACSSCYDQPGAERSILVVPCFESSRIYFIDARNPLELKLKKAVEPKELLALGVSAPHTPHCLADGNIMISTLGDAHGKNQGKLR